jgi:signal transduction histidine kinase
MTNLFIDKSIRVLFLSLAVIFTAAIAASQMMVWNNSQLYKRLTLESYYNFAGALMEINPELADEIQTAFREQRTGNFVEKGRELLERSGYTDSLNIVLVTEADEVRKSGMIGFLLLFGLLAPAVLLYIAFHIFRLGRKINRYDREIKKVMQGDTMIRIEEDEEGSLSRFAASVNQLVISLNTHIEKEKQSRIFLKDILENVSHQLKTPLAALGMYVEIMKEEKPDNEVVTGFLDKCENELERMGGLIANLLKLARLDTRIIELNKGKHSLREIVEESAASLETRMVLEQKQFVIIADGKAEYICDRQWMLEAFSNLLKNAVEHTGEGCRIETEIEEGPLIAKIVFRDNGEGIHPDDINHVFKRFYRSQHPQNKQQGTGIGLTLSKAVVELHGGYITVESSPLKGTEFTVTLPILTNL